MEYTKKFKNRESRQQMTQLKKMATDMNRVLKRRGENCQELSLKVFTILAIGETQIKTTLGFPLTPVRRAYVRKAPAGRILPSCPLTKLTKINSTIDHHVFFRNHSHLVPPIHSTVLFF